MTPMMSVSIIWLQFVHMVCFQILVMI